MPGGVDKAEGLHRGSLVEWMGTDEICDENALPDLWNLRLTLLIKVWPTKKRTLN